MKRNSESKISKIWMSTGVFWFLMLIVVLVIIFQILGKTREHHKNNLSGNETQKNYIVDGGK